ncbi:unnamed protein product [Tilletia laevis]|uniref:Uncharacterized protein n=1 Tax=Tilletia caries TaxID=13290 RepID=A0ABN7J5B4_9BASI|nr:hypothetical protein CF336_g6407 [Tilletia laevis]CAD6884287.1 unnamed protein product [Tilletia caries]KAE8192939.1 hypothetical protein CF335_g5716 [Tilletia laevis]CAD6898348.1 unnamed protein product [Tilletia caries]CAD6940480.1 unnamed protein product [Tilletia caries]
MSAIGGVYDFLYVPFLLPARTVQSLLPENSRLLPVPSSILSALSLEGKTDHDDAEPRHLVALQLGYQKGTGPLLMPFGLNFSEAKLEIPFVSHPHAQERSFLLKQTIIFSSSLLSISSNLVAGLKSHTASFTPKGVDAPRNVSQDSAEAIQYNVANFLESSFEPSPSKGGSPEPESNLDTLRALTTIFHSDWFGHKTGKTINRFEYARLSTALPTTAITNRDAAEIGPRQYVASVPLRLWLDAFRHGPAAATAEGGDLVQVPAGTKVWRVRAQYRSFVRSL